MQISVENFGKVISKEDQKNIFKLFYKGVASPSHEAEGDSWGVGLTHLSFAAKVHKGKNRSKKHRKRRDSLCFEIKKRGPETWTSLL